MQSIRKNTKKSENEKGARKLEIIGRNRCGRIPQSVLGVPGTDRHWAPLFF